MEVDNTVNDDMLGSMEFACAVSGAKVVLVLGHTACGAVKGAIDDVVLGNLTALLARIKPAIAATKFGDDKTSKNPSYVDAVAETNVILGLSDIRRRSPLLEELEKKGSIKIAGAAAGTAVSAASKGKQVSVPSESLLEFRLEQPVSLPVAR
jgi:carbonic anhydrase